MAAPKSRLSRVSLIFASVSYRLGFPYRLIPAFLPELAPPCSQMVCQFHYVFVRRIELTLDLGT